MNRNKVIKELITMYNVVNLRAIFNTSKISDDLPNKICMSIYLYKNEYIMYRRWVMKI